MKKLIIGSIAAILTIITVQTHAQSIEDEVLVKNEIKTTKTEEKGIRKEKKEERETLRKLKGKDVSEIAKRNFISDFGDISDVHWLRRSQFDEATFVKDGKKMTAFYDYNSILVGTTQNKSFSDIPENAQNKILDKYKGYNIGDVVFFDDNEANETDMVYEGVQFDDEDSYFVALSKGKEKFVLKVTGDDDVEYFTSMK